MSKLFLKTSVVTALFAVFVLLAQSAHAQTNNTKPGWGFGDDHHVHTGPPGQSDRPEDHDKDRDDRGKIGNNPHDEFVAFEQKFQKLFAIWFQKFLKNNA